MHILQMENTDEDPGRGARDLLQRTWDPWRVRGDHVGARVRVRNAQFLQH